MRLFARSSRLARIAAGSAAIVLLAASSGCTSNNFMGISLKIGMADATVQRLAICARAGDKRAQLELGIRFEEGAGVPKDRRRANQLYRRAASDSGGTLWIYQPSPGGGAPARVVPVEAGPRQAGLEEAKERLRTIR